MLSDTVVCDKMDSYFTKHILFTGTIFLVLSGFVTADTCSTYSGTKTCPGSFDNYDESYCCGTVGSQYCCDYNDYFDDIPYDDHFDDIHDTGEAIISVAAIVGIVIAVIIVIVIVISITVCICIARRRTGTVIRAPGMANQAVVTTTQVAASPYPTNNPGVAGYSGPAAPAVVVNPPYPVGPTPVTGGPPPMANYGPGQPQPNHANPAVDPAKVAPPSSYAPPPSYEQTAAQTSQMMTPATAPAPGGS